MTTSRQPRPPGAFLPFFLRFHFFSFILRGPSPVGDAAVPRATGGDTSMARIYLDAARVLDGALSRRSSVKTLVYNTASSSDNHRRQLLALVTQTLEHKAHLQKALDASGASEALSDVRLSLQLILAFEMLLGKGIIGGGSIKKVLKRFRAEMLAQLPEHVKARSAAAGGGGSAKARRYIRINTMKCSDASAIGALRAIASSLSGERRDPSSEAETSRRIGSIVRDDMVAHLVAVEAPEAADAFAAGAFKELVRRIATSDAVSSGLVVLQDKASCFSAHAMLEDGWRGGSVIDACAAPGNKTTHLAALLHEWSGGAADAPGVIAFDKDAARAAVLKRRAALMGGEDGPVRVVHGDFLEADGGDEALAGVRGVLLDPSCSGSGMAAHAAELSEDPPEGEEARVRKLAAFQRRALGHALSFPGVERVVYSTCSLYRAENEDVVASAMEEHRGAWELRKVLRAWPRRGLPHDGLAAAESACLVRARPEDGTHGFFVACFHRRVGAGPGPAAGELRRLPAAARSEPVPLRTMGTTGRAEKAKAAHGEGAAAPAGLPQGASEAAARKGRSKSSAARKRNRSPAAKRARRAAKNAKRGRG